MGSCLSSPAPPPQSEEVDEEKLHSREIDKQLKEAKAKMSNQIKVLLLGSGDSGKSTVLKQMRLIHKVPFSPAEIETFRQLVFDNLVRGMRKTLDAMDMFDMKISPENIPNVEIIDNAKELEEKQPFPTSLIPPLRALWADPVVQKAYIRGNEVALPENLPYFFSHLDRVFQPNFHPTEQDIIRCRARTVGITETTFHLRNSELVMVDVGGQKSERRKWIHCFQEVTSILFLVSLSGYDQCLVEDGDANQMQDAMTIWDSICHSQWFKQTSVILFLNKNDLFEKKVPGSSIKAFFPDYDGPLGDVKAGRDYFKKRFGRLAQKAGRSKEREIYMHITTATDTAMLRVVLAAVEVRLLVKTFERLCYEINKNKKWEGKGIKKSKSRFLSFGQDRGDTYRFFFLLNPKLSRSLIVLGVFFSFFALTSLNVQPLQVCCCSIIYIFYDGQPPLTLVVVPNACPIKAGGVLTPFFSFSVFQFKAITYLYTYGVMDVCVFKFVLVLLIGGVGGLIYISCGCRGGVLVKLGRVFFGSRN